jgi:hypothetical protein
MVPRDAEFKATPFVSTPSVTVTSDLKNADRKIRALLSKKEQIKQALKVRRQAKVEELGLDQKDVPVRDFSVILEAFQEEQVFMMITKYSASELRAQLDTEGLWAAVYANLNEDRDLYYDSQIKNRDVPMLLHREARTYPTVHEFSDTFKAVVWSPTNQCWILLGMVKLPDNLGYVSKELAFCTHFDNKIGTPQVVDQERGLAMTKKFKTGWGTYKAVGRVEVETRHQF